MLAILLTNFCFTLSTLPTSLQPFLLLGKVPLLSLYLSLGKKTLFAQFRLSPASPNLLTEWYLEDIGMLLHPCTNTYLDPHQTLAQHMQQPVFYMLQLSYLHVLPTSHWLGESVRTLKPHSYPFPFSSKGYHWQTLGLDWIISDGVHDITCTTSQVAHETSSVSWTLRN